MKKGIVKVVLLIALLTAGFIVKAEERPIHEVHAMMIFNFIKYVEWPDEAKSGKFTIGVFGDTDLLSNLEKFYTNRTVNGQSVEIVYFKKLSEVRPTQVLYLADNENNNFAEVKGVIAGNPTLLITDGDKLGTDGSCINFKTNGGKLKFEINKSSIEQNHLKVSSQLMSMGVVI